MLDLEHFLTWIGKAGQKLTDDQKSRIRFLLQDQKDEIQNQISRFVLPTPLTRDVRFLTDFYVKIQPTPYFTANNLYKIIFNDPKLNDVISITKLAMLIDNAETVIDSNDYYIDDRTKNLMLFTSYFNYTWSSNLGNLRIEGSFGIVDDDGNPHKRLINAIFMLVSQKAGVLSRKQYTQQDGTISVDNMENEVNMAKMTIYGYAVN